MDSTPSEDKMPHITMYSSNTCPYCVQAQALFDRKGVTVNKIMIDQTPLELTNMIERTGRRTVPQIFIGETYVGGFTDLHKLEQSGQLDQLLQP
jgi:glutaredoxin 3